MKPSAFFDTHRVFRVEEFVEAHSAGGRRSRQTSASVLRQHVNAGNLIHVRRGVYASVPKGARSESFAPDRFLVACALQRDAVVAYHGALRFHGRAYSVWRRLQYLTAKRAKPLSFRGCELAPVRASARWLLEDGVVQLAHAGGTVRVTSLERTLVDVLDAPRYGGGWEEIWRSLEMIEYFDLDAVVVFARKTGSGSTAARVGLFLEQHREALMVEERYLDALREYAPKKPLYLDRRREPGKLVPGWNLVVPERVLERRWEEGG